MLNVRDPIVDGDSAHYWESAKARELVAQQCDSCREFVFYPRSVCPHCHSGDLTWRTSAGHGIVYSYTVSRRAPSPEFEGMVPYVVALVDLDEGFRMMSNIVGTDALGTRCGDRVEVDFEQVSDETTLPVFRLVKKLEEER
ncbi:MAG: hypothetical protein JWP11_2606 [Frankiales bacterium]|nr:hypothetical protein [Frankiales bacterium]